MRLVRWLTRLLKPIFLPDLPMPPNARPGYEWALLANALFLASVVLHTVFTGYVVDLAGAPMADTVVLVPFAYLLLMLIIDVYGLAAGRAVALTGTAAQAFTYGVGRLIHLLPVDPVSQGHDPTFYGLIALPPLAAAWVMLIFWLSCLLCGQLYSRGRDALLKAGRYHVRHLWVRLVVIPLAGQTLWIALATPVIYWGLVDRRLLVLLTVDRFLAAVMVTSAAMPFVLAAARWLRKQDATAAQALAAQAAADPAP